MLFNYTANISFDMIWYCDSDWFQTSDSASQMQWALRKNTNHKNYHFRQR